MAILLSARWCRDVSQQQKQQTTAKKKKKKEEEEEKKSTAEVEFRGYLILSKPFTVSLRSFACTTHAVWTLKRCREIMRLRKDDKAILTQLATMLE